jgi:hypothetical protein
LTHKRIKRFQIEGTFKDDSAIPRLKELYSHSICQEMRSFGYVPVLDLDPLFTILYLENDTFSFLMTMHGVYVGKAKAWKIEGISNGRMLPRNNTQKSKLKKLLNQSTLS